MKEIDEDKQKQPLILIVDDAPQNLRVLGNMLKEANYRIAVAEKGRQVLELVSTHEILPDLILLDVMMPGLDGFEVCTQLKKTSEVENIPIIFLTAKTATDTIEKGFQCGAVDYVTKPFNGTELLARVKTHLELKHAREELSTKNNELSEIRKKLDHAARTDPLTQIANRLDILEKIELEKIRFERSRKPFTLVLCDIDDFKQYNDKYGHQCGDFILLETSNLLRALLRKQDIVSRWGGEEFLSMLPETDAEGGRILAGKIKETIAAQVYLYDNAEFSITMTVGVVTYEEGGSQDVDTCIKQAETALLEGKKKGKNCVVVFTLNT
jgi:two-component system, cell cycle response regulator